MIDDLKSRLEEAFPDAEVAVAGEGNRFEVHVVSAAFEGLSRVARQRAVYAVIGDLIASGAIHAVTIRASTLDENP
ncbi:MAG: BolA/IbaG family iron-sulfur metabolism protein [Gammaproteobacteria bacterium]|nr:BolA/IbaG family iron-sulfur metabolism protein [Gammaproteobacteria bacterium]